MWRSSLRNHKLCRGRIIFKLLPHSKKVLSLTPTSGRCLSVWTFHVLPSLRGFSQALPKSKEMQLAWLTDASKLPIVVNVSVCPFGFTVRPDSLSFTFIQMYK